MTTEITQSIGQDSFEFGKAGARQTLKFMTPEELDAKIKRLRELGYIDNEGNPIVPSIVKPIEKPKKTDISTSDQK